jgi:hypothetical protein
LSATDVSLTWYEGAVEAPVESVALPPIVPSFVHDVPEIFEGVAVNETFGFGTAACAVGIKKYVEKSKKAPAMTAGAFFTLLITD